MRTHLKHYPAVLAVVEPHGHRRRVAVQVGVGVVGPAVAVAVLLLERLGRAGEAELTASQESQALEGTG